jgi:hypothetical protein
MLQKWKQQEIIIKINNTTSMVKYRFILSADEEIPCCSGTGRRLNDRHQKCPPLDPIMNSSIQCAFRLIILKNDLNTIEISYERLLPLTFFETKRYDFLVFRVSKGASTLLVLV